MSTNLSVTPRNRRNPFSMMPVFARELFDFDRLFDSMIGDESAMGADLIGTRLDLVENDKAFEIRVDLPGVKPEQVEVNVEKNVLTIRGERSEEKEEGGKNQKYHRVERRFGSFSRSLVLPSGVADDEAVASFKDGVLKVILPKNEKSKTRKIEIKK